MTPESFLQLLTVGGGAGVLYWVVRLIVDGRLHSDSEVNGLRQDKSDLLKANAALTSQLTETNKQLGEIVSVLRERP